MTGSTRSFNWGYPLGGFAGSRKATPWGLLGSPPGSRPLGMTNLPSPNLLYHVLHLLPIMSSTSPPYSPCLPVRSLPRVSAASSPTTSLSGERRWTGGDILNRAAAPTHGNEMLVASEAIGDENDGIPESRVRCSNVMRRKDKKPPEASNTSTSLKLCWR